MKEKIIYFAFISLLLIIAFLRYSNNKMLKEQLKNKELIIQNMEQRYTNNSLDIEKMNKELKQYQKENEKLIKEIRNVESDCLYTCKIPEELKKILEF